MSESTIRANTLTANNNTAAHVPRKKTDMGNRTQQNEVNGGTPLAEPLGSPLIERMVTELRNWVDPMIDIYMHQNSLGETCGCYQCVWKRSKRLVDEFKMANT